MSNQSGFDYDLLVSRLHGGLCAFQSLRAHRRQREQAAAPVHAPAPAPAAEERMAPPPRVARVVDEPADLRESSAAEPQAFVNMGGRMVPIFDLSAGLPGSMAQAPATDMPAPPAPGAMSAPEETRPPPPIASAPPPTASTLKLPAPTPPPRLGLVYGGGHGRAPAPAPASDASTPPAATSEPHAAHAGDPASPTLPPPAQGTPTAATLAALLDARAEQEALRLEKLHAEHRAVLATLLQEHREELRARSEAEAAREAQRQEALRTRSEAEAARSTQLLREILQEHRAELARAAQTHAEQLAQLLSHQHTAQHEAVETELRGALIEQASLQRDAHADVAENIDALTSIVADLGQTVGLLAVAAAQADKQGRFPTRTTFVPPPQVEPAVVAPAPCAVLVPDAAPHVETAAPPRLEPTAAANAVAPVTAVPASSALVGPAASPSAHPTPPLADTIAVEPAQRRRIHGTLAQEAAARVRVSQAVDEDRDDDDLETEDDDPQPHRPLGPITALDHPNIKEPGDD